MEQTVQKIEELSFEQSIKELEIIVKDLESGSQDLEKSIFLYERGNKLKAICEKKLAEAKLKVDKITKSIDGSVKLEQFSE